MPPPKMPIDERTYEQLDDFASGTIPDKDRVAFQQLLKSNAELRAELDWLQMARAAVREEGRVVLNKQIAAIALAIPKSAFQKYSPSLNGTSFLKKWGWAFAVAAAVVISVLAWKYFTHHQQSEAPKEQRPADGAAVQQNFVPNKNSVADSCAADSVKKDSPETMQDGDDTGAMGTAKKKMNESGKKSNPSGGGTGGSKPRKMSVSSGIVLADEGRTDFFPTTHYENKRGLSKTTSQGDSLLLYSSGGH